MIDVLVTALAVVVLGVGIPAAMFAPVILSRLASRLDQDVTVARRALDDSRAARGEVDAVVAELRAACRRLDLVTADARREVERLRAERVHS